MALLRRVLYWQAAAWAAGGLALAAFPAAVVEGLLRQPPVSGYGWVRIGGVQGFTLALLMVLVGHRVDELWWWSWAFVLAAAGLATVAVLSLVLDLPEGAPVLPWGLLALVAGGFTAGLLWGLARAGQERPLP